jgi:predicted Zn-dependent protease
VPELPRAYRYRPLVELLDALEAREERAERRLEQLSRQPLDRAVRPVVRAFLAEVRGDLGARLDALQAAATEVNDGELDCIVWAELARARAAAGDRAGADAACAEVLQPRLPAVFCHAVRPGCVQP